MILFYRQAAADYDLVVTGHCWSVLRKHYPEELRRIVVKATVFARMSPEQKQQLVETLQDIGSVTQQQCAAPNITSKQSDFCVPIFCFKDT